MSYNAITLLRKADEEFSVLMALFPQNAFAEGPEVDPLVRARVVQLQVDLKDQIKHIEKTGELEQVPHVTIEQGRAEKSNKGRQHQKTRKEGYRHHKKGFGKGGGLTGDEVRERQRKDREAENRIRPGFHMEPDDAGDGPKLGSGSVIDEVPEEQVI